MLLALLVSYLMGCANLGPPRPDSGYRADVSVRITPASGQESALTRFVEFYYIGKRRLQTSIEGNEVVLIDRADLQVSWKLNPRAKTFEEYRISSSEAMISSVPNPFGRRARAEFKLLGTENVDGVEAQKYAVTGEMISGFAWFTPDRIPIRFDGQVGPQDSPAEMEVAYSDVRRGPQAAYLFAVPPTYAGYETRKQRSFSKSTDDTGRRLEEQAQGRQYPYGAAIPPAPPPPPPPSY